MKLRNYFSKIFPFFIAAVLLFVSCISFPVLFVMKEAENKKYTESMSEALKLENDGIYTDAEELYYSALESTGDMYPVYMGLARCEAALNEKNEFLNSCEKAIELDCTREDAYLLLISYYSDNNQSMEIYTVAERACENGCSSQKIKNATDKLDGQFSEKYLSADSVGDWNGAGGTSYAVFQKNGLYGILRSDGYMSLSAGYERLGVYSSGSGTFPALEDGVWSWLDGNGHRRIAAPQGTTEAGTFDGGLAPVCVKGKWYYCGTDGELSLVGFDYAGMFSEGVAAVMKNGKWALIDENMRSITAYEYDLIKTDSNGACAAHGTVVVRKGNLYYLCSTAGKLLSEGFEDIALPAEENSYIAFCLEGMWGFMDTEGQTVISAKYKEAKSFSKGYAPVYEGAYWYYINENGEAVNDCRYSMAGCFSSEGRAVVRKENGLYLITLSRYS